MGSSTSVSSRSEDHFSRLLGAARLRAEALLNRPGIHRLRQTDERCSVSERRTARTGGISSGGNHKDASSLKYECATVLKE